MLMMLALMRSTGVVQRAVTVATSARLRPPAVLTLRPVCRARSDTYSAEEAATVSVTSYVDLRSTTKTAAIVHKV